MDPIDIANKAKKVIEMYRDTYLYNNVYFNPAFLSDFFSQVPELEEAGINAITTEADTEEGNIISGMLKSRDRDLDLGSVVLDGAAVYVDRDLQPVNRMLEFITSELLHEEAKYST